MSWKLIYEDNDMLIVRKPQGMPAQADKTGDPDLLSTLEQRCGQRLGLIHRLDRPVGGLLVFAKTKPAEAVLTQALANGMLEKRYLAVLCGKMPEERGTLVHYLKKDARTNTSRVAEPTEKMAKKAILHYNVLEIAKKDGQLLSLVQILLETGRHHQIRVQTSLCNAPIWGDKKYNPACPRGGRTDIALWAYSLRGLHPATKEPWHFQDIPETEPFCFFSEKR